MEFTSQTRHRPPDYGLLGRVEKAYIGIGAAILGGSAIVAAAGLYGASKASKAGRSGARSAAAAELEMYYQSREDLAPWRNRGKWALRELEERMGAGPGKFEQDPGYLFRLGEGEKAINRAAASRGKYFAGQTGKALMQYGQDYATGEYQNFLNRYYQSLTPWQSLAGLGQTSAAQSADMAVRTGGGVAQSYLAGGQARASGYINQANVLSGAVTSGTQNYLYNNYLQQLGQQGGGANTFQTNPAWIVGPT